MTKRTKFFFNDCRGATAIEFALLAPLLFLLTFATIEFSLIMFTSSAIESATTIGSRLGKTGYTDPKALDENGNVMRRKDYIRRVMRERLGGLINQRSVVIESRTYPNLESADGTPGNPTGGLGGGSVVVEYTVRYRWPILTPFMKELIGDDEGYYDIVSTALVRNEPF